MNFLWMSTDWYLFQQYSTEDALFRCSKYSFDLSNSQSQLIVFLFVHRPKDIHDAIFSTEYLYLLPSLYIFRFRSLIWPLDFSNRRFVTRTFILLHSLWRCFLVKRQSWTGLQWVDFGALRFYLNKWLIERRSFYLFPESLWKVVHFVIGFWTSLIRGVFFPLLKWRWFFSN